MFVLREDAIEVTSGVGDKRSTAIFPLNTISPDYAVGSLRFNVGIVLMLVFAVALAALTLFLMRQKSVTLSSLAAYSAIFGAAAVVTGIRLIPRFDFLTFSDHWKRPLFSIARERSQSEECDTFVADLLNRLERKDEAADGGVGHANEILSEGIDPPTEWRWILALSSGGTTLGYTTLAQWFKDLSPVVFVVLLAGTAGAMVAAFYSYIANERHRHWGLVGVALAWSTFVIFQKA